MTIKYEFKDGRGRNEGAFDRSYVHIANPHKKCTVDLLRKLECFALKKHAKEFCLKWNIKPVAIVKLTTRFQETWVVDLGRNSFMPCFAEGYLIALEQNKTFVRAYSDECYDCW